MIQLVLTKNKGIAKGVAHYFDATQNKREGV